MTVGSKARLTALASVLTVLPDHPRFAGVIRGRARKPALQRGCAMPCASVRAVIRGGTENRLRTSRSRTPATCTSTVSTSAS